MQKKKQPQCITVKESLDALWNIHKMESKQLMIYYLFVIANRSLISNDLERCISVFFPLYHMAACSLLDPAFQKKSILQFLLR